MGGTADVLTSLVGKLEGSTSSIGRPGRNAIAPRRSDQRADWQRRLYRESGRWEAIVEYGSAALASELEQRTTAAAAGR